MTLQKKIQRSLKKNLSFYITGSILTALCIMLWVGAFSVSMTVGETYTELFDENIVEDARFTVSAPITDEDISALESEFNVLLERQCFRNISYDNASLRLYSDTNKVDKTVVFEGEALSSDADVLITYNFAKAHDISVGDIITLDGGEYTVRALCIRPDYAAMYANFEDSFPNSVDFGLAVIPENAMKTAGAYSSCYSVKYLDAGQENAFRSAVYDKFGTLEYIGRAANPRT